MEPGALYRKVLKEERRYLNNALDEVLGTDSGESEVSYLSAEDTDRLKADKERVKDIGTSTDGGGSSDNSSKSILSGISAHAQFQEEQRMRRDVRSVKQTHKRFMLGCLSTMYSRKITLDAILNKSE